MLQLFLNNCFLLSRRGTKREADQPCPVDINSLCAIHNAIASYRLQHPNGGDLSKDSAFSKLFSVWKSFQTKYAARSDHMHKSHRIHPQVDGHEIICLNTANQLIGTTRDLALGSKQEKISKLSCSLRPERENGAPPQQFADLYDKRCVTYNATNLGKATAEQLGNAQLLVRMEMQYLVSCEVAWKPPAGGSSLIEAGGRVADSADGGIAGESSKEVDQHEASAPSSPKLSQSLSILDKESPPPLSSTSAASTAGSIACVEDHLLFALRSVYCNKNHHLNQPWRRI